MKTYLHPQMVVLFPSSHASRSLLVCPTEKCLLQMNPDMFLQFVQTDHKIFRILASLSHDNPLFQAVQNSMIPLLFYRFLRCMCIQWGKVAQNPEIVGIHSKWCNCQSLVSFEIPQAEHHKSNSKVVQNPG